jgi:hypothetical protein
MKPGWIIVAGLMLVLVYGITSWRPDPGPVGDAEPAGDMVDELIEPVTALETREPGPVPGAGAGEVAAVARRLAHVPDTRPEKASNSPTTDERDVTAENISSLLEANLEYALTGDLVSGYFVTRSRQTCDRFAGTPEELERAISRINRRVERAQARGRDVPGTAEFDQPWSYTSDPETNRAHLERWYDACQRVRSMFTPELRERLEALALGGNVMARYLYATWPQEMLDTGDAFGQQFRWEALAREFSMANMDQGEVAGLLAFGHSYLGGYFTARDRNLALAFAVASLNCGFETISTRSFLASSIEQLTRSEDPQDQQRLQFVLAESDRLSSHCTLYP